MRINSAIDIDDSRLAHTHAHVSHWDQSSISDAYDNRAAALRRNSEGDAESRRHRSRQGQSKQMMYISINVTSLTASAETGKVSDSFNYFSWPPLCTARQTRIIISSLWTRARRRYHLHACVVQQHGICINRLKRSGFDPNWRVRPSLWGITEAHLWGSAHCWVGH